MPSISVEALRPFVAAIFEKAGSLPPEAALIARRLLDANLAGHDSHGVVRVPSYIGWLNEGKIRPNAHVRVVSEADAYAVLDGQSGYGQVIGTEAMDLGIAKARRSGVALIALRHAHHLGRIGDWAEQCAAAGVASMHFVNVVHYGPMVAPFGGAERRFSTNPICLGMPRAGADPIVLDFATSQVAEGKVIVARNKGVDVPADCILDANGQPSINPNDLYGPPEGTLLTFGRHKGSGLALFADMFAGVLSGGGCNHDQDERRGQVHNNMLSILIDVGRIAGQELAEREVGTFIRWVKSAHPAPGVSEVLVPGEPERRAKAARLETGIPVDDVSWAAIGDTARTLGVVPPVA